MIPRVARWIGLGAAGVIGAVIAFAGVAFGTSAGRDVVVGALLRAANDALRGSVTIDSYRGSIYRGLVLRGVRVEDEHGVALARIEQVRVRYRLRDLLSRRIVLGAITLTNPRLDLVRQENGRFNYQEVLGLGGDADAADEGDSGPGPLIAFRDVRIDSALVTIRRYDDTAGTDASRLEIPEAELDYFRIQSPLPTEKGIRIEIASLASRTVNLPLDVRSVRGNIGISGDTVTLDVDEVRLPQSHAALRGWIYPGSEIRVDLDIDGDRLVTSELRDLLPWLPDGVAGSGRILATSLLDDQVRVDASNLALTTEGGGRLNGHLGFLVGPGDAWAADAIDVTTTSLDLDYLRGFIDSIPFRGRLSGRTVADGPRERLAVEVDWAFEDALADRAVTELVGSGVLVLGGEDLVFEAFSVRDGSVIPLATVRALVPAVALRGVLETVGTLDGPLHNAEFRGVARHYFGAFAPTVAGGTVRLDTRGDTLGVWGDLVMDSLRFETIRPSYPSLRVAGSYAGQISIAGYAHALVVDADLRGADGELRGEGVFIVIDEQLGFQQLNATFRRVALDAVHPELPRTRLSGYLRGSLVSDPASPLQVDLTLGLERFSVAAVGFDSGFARVTSRARLLEVDTLRAWAPGTAVTGSGAVAMEGPPSGTVQIQMRSDSAERFAPLVGRFVGRSPADIRTDSVSGRLDASVTVGGTLDTLRLFVGLSGSDLRWNDVRVTGGQVDLDTETGVGALALAVEVDSVAVGELGFAAISFAAERDADTLRWQARSRMGADGAFLVGGRFEREGDVLVVHADSMALLLARDIWFAERGAAVTLTDSTVVISNLTLATADEYSRVSLNGVLPRRGRGELEGSVQGLAVEHMRALVQLPVERASGEVGGTVRLGGTARDPVLSAAVQIRNFTMNEFRAPLTNGRMEYRNRRLTGVVSLVRSGEEILNVDVSLPLDLALRGAATERKLPGRLEIRARADGVDLDFVNAVFPYIRRASGQFWSNLGITGSWDRPQLTGFLRIADGAASFPALGVRHERIDGQLRLSGDTIYVDRFSVAAGNGTAEVGGFVRLEGLTRPNMRLDIAAQNFFALDVPDFLTVTTSGSVRLEGPVFGAVLTGNGTVTDGALYFADIVEKDIIDLEDTTFVIDPETAALIRQQGLGAAFQNRFLDSLRIDTLGLTMGREVHLLSSEADILMTGDVTVSKRGRQYRIDGTLQTPRGTYRLPLGPTITKDFAVTRGEVRYFGTPDLNAALDIDARHLLRDLRGDPVEVTVHVGGTINSPTLTLASDVQPPLSDTEIISYLVFGAPSAQAVGGAGGIQYTFEQTASTLAARVSGQFGAQLISDLGVPLDYIEIRPEFGGEGFNLGAEIAVGRAIGERWFVTLNPRLCPQETLALENVGASIEFRVSRQWRLSASADPLGSCFASASSASTRRYQWGIDLLWERRY